MNYERPEINDQMKTISSMEWKTIPTYLWQENCFAHHKKLSFHVFLISSMLKTFSGRQTTQCLTHWDRATHICVSDLTTIDSENGLSPGRHQAIIWTNAGILSIGPMGINLSGIWI